ncbi:MAG: dihydropteroate synthase [Rickettsiales bacterium]|jgi:2-amino-4-hydroxy-6-hydroxymethyldihydropteridine diphosphokinase/dihydropteroate synthase|nr:dihydropteroate synthase [Rickettsiales bacterium]
MSSNDDFVYIALGSNEGDRKGNLVAAIDGLRAYGVDILEVSPLYPNPALLLEGSPDDWNRPFYNCVVKVDTELSPENLLALCKRLERELGRDPSRKFGPRTIDLDILFYKNQVINSDKLTIPHRGIYSRSFVLDPLSFVYPEKAGDYYGRSHQPLTMGIINVTPDSFSDGGKHYAPDSAVELFEQWERADVSAIDIGAESTNPNSRPLEEREEIRRLEPIFDYIRNRNFGYFRPLLSIDSYHPGTAELALASGFDMVNDVSGLGDERMLDLARNYRDAKFIFMHSLAVPTRRDVVLVGDPLEEMGKWIGDRARTFERIGLDKNRLIFDVGLGFGKTASQNLKLLQNMAHFHSYGFKILVGHSRKSFMDIFTGEAAGQRDLETIALSLGLAKDVDILRVHSPLEHRRALLASGHLANQFIGGSRAEG